MSWQDYVDNQLLASQCVSKAAIAGHDGGIWAKSEAFEVSTDLSLLHCPYFFLLLLGQLRRCVPLTSVISSRNALTVWDVLEKVLHFFTQGKRPYQL